MSFNTIKPGKCSITHCALVGRCSFRRFDVIFPTVLLQPTLGPPIESNLNWLPCQNGAEAASGGGPPARTSVVRTCRRTSLRTDLEDVLAPDPESSLYLQHCKCLSVPVVLCMQASMQTSVTTCRTTRWPCSHRSSCSLSGSAWPGEPALPGDRHWMR